MVSKLFLMLHWCFNPLMTIDGYEQCRSRSDNNMASDRGLHDIGLLLAMLGDALYEWCDERISFMKFSNNMDVVRTVQSDRHPCCSFRFILCLSITSVSIKQMILLVVRFITTLVRKKKQQKKKLLTTSDNDKRCRSRSNTI